MYVPWYWIGPVPLLTMEALHPWRCFAQSLKCGRSDHHPTGTCSHGESQEGTHCGHLRDSDVRKRWEEKFGSPPNDQDVESMYRSFLPLQKEVILRYSDAIPGARDALAQLRQKGIAIGSSTGYTRELMDHLLPTVRAQGIDPDVVICSDDVRAGRPKPWMIYEALQRLDRTPVWRTVVVDDTTAGVEAGLHAGCWTVAVSRSGNELGLSLEDAEAVSPDRMNQILADIKNRFLQQGADIVIETVSELPSAIAEIESRMKRGCLPRALNTMQ